VFVILPDRWRAIWTTHQGFQQRRRSRRVRTR
jgi:hypothetical protein